MTNTTPVAVVTQSTPTAPLQGNAPWGTPSQHPAVAGFANSAETQIVRVANDRVEQAGGPLRRR
jgi:hypothetical protein